jgi:cytosine/adenosine deaminase-related metal-dependent hydrolase
MKSHRSTLLVRARVVLPMSAPPISDGAVLVAGRRIRAVGRWRDLAAAGPPRCLDLGDTVLLPGLVNAHCHLDYTDMAGLFPQPRVFTDWLKLITTTKATWSRSEYTQSWLHGARMLLRSGTTTVADIEAVPELLPQVWDATPLRVISLFEMIGLTKRRTPEAILGETLDRIAALGATRSRAGLSPHAPWSTLPELMRLSAREARRRRLLLCTHVAESALEFEMFTRGRGEMFHWLERSTRDMSDCGRGSPVEHLKSCGALGRNLLAIHVNYLGKQDARLLGQNQAHVVHCPRSHYYFRHDAFPLRRLLNAGVNVCLGTDSLASVLKHRRQTIELSMFEEMRALAARQPRLPARKILEMATLNGAKALGFAKQLGQISPGAWADLIALPFAGGTAGVFDAIVGHRGDVSASMIAGRWAIVPPQLNEPAAPPPGGTTAEVVAHPAA